MKYHPRYHTRYIVNNPKLRQKHPGVPVGPDGSDGISYPLTEKYPLVVAQATDCVAYVASLLCTQKVVMYTHHQNNTCVTLFAEAIVML